MNKKDHYKLYQKKYHKIYYQKYKTHYRDYHRDYCNKDRIKWIRYSREYQEKHKTELKKYRKQYDDKHRKKINKYFRKWKYKKYYSDPCFKLIVCQRYRIWHCIKREGGIKKNKTLDLLGCTAEQLKQHLESLWGKGMNWENYGKFGWHVDHIKPLASFDLTNPEQQKIAFHYTNLQPLWANENLTKNKGNRR